MAGLWRPYSESHHPRLRLVVLLGYGVGKVNPEIDITSAVWQLATRCLILGVGFPGKTMRQRHCCGRNCSTWATVELGFGPHYSSSDFFPVYTQYIPSLLWLCWLGDRKAICPVKIVVRYWHGYLSGARCKWFAYGPADATATPSSHALVKSRMVHLTGAGSPRLFWKRGR